MKKKIERYFQWLSQGNVLIFNPEKSQNQLTFEGKSYILWKIILNSLLSLLTIFALPAVIIMFDLRNPVTIILTVITSLGGLIWFGIGLIVFAYHPFWIHKNKITISKEGLHTINSIGFASQRRPKKMKTFTLRYEFVEPGIVNLQFWVNQKKQYFVNAFMVNFAHTKAEVFDYLKEYMSAWGLEYIDISPQKSAQSGTFIFKRTGKVSLDLTVSLSTLQAKAKEIQLQVSDTPELIAKYWVQQQEDNLQITRPKNYNRNMWIGFLLSFVLGGSIIFGLLYMMIYHPSDEKIGMIVFMVVIGFLWVVFSGVFYGNATANFCLQINDQQLYVRLKKGKEHTYDLSQIENIAIQGVITTGRSTHVWGNILLVLKTDDREQKPLKLLTIDSGRPEKIDTQLVRDAAYERSMRIAQLIAQPMDLSVDWKGFKE